MLNSIFMVAALIVKIQSVQKVRKNFKNFLKIRKKNEIIKRFAALS